MSEEALRYELSVGSNESIAESNIVERVKGLIRDVAQEFREVLSQVKDLSDGKLELVKVRHERIRSIKNTIENNSITIVEYIVRVSPALLHKDIYISIVNGILKSAESCEATSYRALALSTKGTTKIGDMLYLLLESMIKNSINMLEELDNMLTFISVNPRKVGEIYSNIVKLEDSVDDFYRHALVDVVKSKEFDAGDLVLMKELIDKLEDAADHLKDVGTNLRYISLHRI
ncbi:MAG: hypothetical protein QXY36_00315 [Sulfolobales archaeon]